MFKLFSIFATPALLLAATAGVASEPAKSFTHEGVTYRYEKTLAEDGTTVLAGQALPSGSKFRLVVRDGQVSGHVANRPVRFSLASTRGAAVGAVHDRAAPRIVAAD
ncbi:hypothetical protein [Sphingomonas sp.]|uniref:hypothetical protein n=1 Tax=Sphingomonas sp. TaxID=28214 RepID=UPI002DD69F0F|nr:hypothetical protein [Sphingomonas sp.]